MTRGRVAGAALAVVILALSPLHRVAAQETECDPGDVEVNSLNFTGNKAFSAADLADRVVTTASNRWHRWHIPLLGQKHCLNRIEWARDRLRLVLFYRNRGYPQAKVDTVVTPAYKHGVDLTFLISEGLPVIIDSLAVSGVDSLPVRRAIQRRLPLRAKRPFDQFALQASKDSIRRWLRNTGYPDADVFEESDVDTTARVARVHLRVAPGRRARLGAIRLQSVDRKGGKPEIAPENVRRVLRLKEGTVYSESEVLEAQRRLYRTDAYQHIGIDIDSTRRRGDTLVNLDVRLQEGPMHTARLGGGLGTLDCLRTQGDFTDRDFLRGYGRLELTAQFSKIGAGRKTPLQDLNVFCRLAAEDPFSRQINYYIGATIRDPWFIRLPLSDITVYSQRRSEYKAYLRNVPIGFLTSGTWYRVPRWPLSFTYQMELGSTEAQPALFCAVFNLCDPADIERAQGQRRLATAAWTLVNNRSDNAVDPTRGSVLRVDVKHASKLTFSGRDQTFSKLLIDYARYVPARKSVLAARLRIGGVTGGRISFATNSTNNQFIPPAERLFAGGASTVRGFNQNELGPVLYLAESVTDSVVGFDPDNGDTLVYVRILKSDTKKTVPIGGNTVIVGNLEYRARSFFLPDLLQFNFFVDAGQVWNRGGTQTIRLSAIKPRVTPGMGFRLFTPLGTFRTDVGYNPYNRATGPAYYDAPVNPANVSPVLCVNPGNTNLVAKHVGIVNGESVVYYEPQTTECSTGQFTPPPRKTFVSHLTLHFSIGQAF